MWSLTHILHGTVFALIIRLLNPLDIGLAFLAVLGVELAWEILENTEWMIGNWVKWGCVKYRGDSIGNSLGDIACCMIGSFPVLIIG